MVEVQFLCRPWVAEEGAGKLPQTHSRLAVRLQRPVLAVLAHGTSCSPLPAKCWTRRAQLLAA